jgi:rod shape-determining protein MreC
MAKRGFLPPLLLTLLSVALMTYQSSHGPLRTPLGPGGVLYEASQALGRAAQAVAGFKEMLLLRQRELQALRRQVEELKAQSITLRVLQEENRRLRELLELKELSPGYVASANVLGRSLERFGHVLVIDAGRSQGVRKDMAVVAPGGLVGKVLKVQEQHSHVLLLTDIRFSVAVRASSSGLEAVLSGTGGRDCVLKYVPAEAELREGEVLLSSGLDGLFPPGLKVGYVAHVGRAQGLFRQVRARPLAEPMRVREVLVLRP